jgi:hypothetical protein
MLVYASSTLRPRLSAVEIQCLTLKLLSGVAALPQSPELLSNRIGIQLSSLKLPSGVAARPQSPELLSNVIHVDESDFLLYVLTL